MLTALKEEKTKQTTAEAETVKMTGVIPPVQKMDATLGTLTKVRYAPYIVRQCVTEWQPPVAGHEPD